MHMSTAFALPKLLSSNQKRIPVNDAVNDAVNAVINITDAAYDCMLEKLYDQTRVLISKRMSNMPLTESFISHQKHTKIYPFQCDTVLLEQANQIAINQHQSLASFVRQSVAAAVNNYRKQPTT